MQERLFAARVVSSGLCILALGLSFIEAQPDSLVKITTVEGITEYRLSSNGLKVLLFPDPTASTVTVNVTYLVGSRHEGRGEKGMAHLLEHMVFKGTAKRGNIWEELQDHGARFNGTTSSDRTNYYETLAASEENLDFALEMEADRMVNSLISADTLAKEMALRFANFVFGQSANSRLMNALRHEGGLSYGAGSMLSVDDEDSVGQLLAYAICAPQNVEETQRVMQAEFESLFTDGLSQEEIDEYRKGYIEDFKTRLARDSYVVSQLLTDVRTGRDFRFHEQVVMAAENLSYDDVRAALQRVSEANFVDLKGGDVAKFGGE